MKPGTQVIIFKYNSWSGNVFGIRRITKEDYFAFCQHLDTFEKEEHFVSVPVGNSHVVLTGKEVVPCIEIFALTEEIDKFLDKLFLCGSDAIGVDIAGMITSEVTWKEFLAEEQNKKEQHSKVEE